MLSNREMFASMTLEPRDSVISPPASAPQQQGRDAMQEENTQRIIGCMKHALSTSLSNISAQLTERPLDPSKDFVFKTKINFAPGPSHGTFVPCCSQPDPLRADGDDEELDGVNRAGSFTFTDYAPMCYRQIRGFFGIDWKTFLDVLCKSKWYSIPTPGKSTAQLFFCGQNWVIKTMTRGESTFLREILHRYYYHVRDNPYTLLPHFVGHHSLELTLLGTRKKISFVIMQNVFATPNQIDEKYDLKGSTVGRFAAPSERKKQTSTKKDLDIDRVLRIGAVRKPLFMAQLKRDCDFLRKGHIMDYSLLVGIHFVAQPDALMGSPSRGAKTPEDERCFTADLGGMMSLAGPGGSREIYYMGIIDILQEYNLRKQSETALRGIIEDRKHISSVEPRMYAARFLEFMDAVIV